MQEIKKDVENLKESPLYEYRKKNNYQPVTGEGSLNTDIVFIGEAPGKNEAETGKPFCGRAGKLLNKFLKKAGIERNEVYITNVVKDRPPNNRKPTKKEVDLYAPFLIKQLQIIKPQLTITLGSTATKFAFNHFKIGKDFKNFSEVQGKAFPVKINKHKSTLLPLYHPAYSIYQRRIRPQMEKDFKKIPNLLK